MKALLNISLFVLFVFAKIILAQQEMRFEHITEQDGLPENSVRCILQDYQGFLWFGTQNGLVKFDGHKLVVYHYNPSDSHGICGFSITSIFEDKLKNLCIATENGISIYNREKNLFDNLIIGNKERDRLNIYSICEDAFNNLYFGSHYSGFGLLKFNKNNKTYVQYLHDSLDNKSIGSNNIRGVFREDSLTIWIGTIGGGLNKFDINTQIFKRYKNIPGDSNSISSNDVYSIYKDRSGNIWVCTSNGLNRFDKIKESFTAYGISPKDEVNLKGRLITTIYEDTSSFSLWLGVWEYGLIKFDPVTCKFSRFEHNSGKSYTLSNDLVSSVLMDRSGIMWVGTTFGGLNKYDGYKSRFMCFNNVVKNNSSDNVYSILEDSSGTIWLSTSSGIISYNRKAKTFLKQNIFGNIEKIIHKTYTTLLFYDRYECFWLGTTNGLLKYDSRNGKLTRYTHTEGDSGSISCNHIRELYEDKRGNLWIGTVCGLSVYDREKNIFRSYYHNDNDSNSLSNNDVISIYEDRTGNFWIGTNFFGLNKFDRDRNSFKTYYYPELNFICIMSIFEDKNDNLLVGTFYGGLFLFDRNTGEVKQFSERKGLIHNSVYSILGDNRGNLWIGTENGLSRFNPETGKIKNFDKNDLPFTFFYSGSMKDKDGYLYFGCKGGFIMFHPDSLGENTIPPPVVLTAFRIFNKSVQPSDNSPLKKNINIAEEINLTYKENEFSIEFAALDYHNPMRNQYAYKLEGFNNDWIHTDAQNRTATYTNLDPGKYIFRVKGSNNDGVWNEEGASIRIIITPPWWATWWFRSIYILAFSGIIAFAWQRKHRTVQNNLQKQKDFTKQLIESQEKERKRIAGELHDSLGQNLLIIKNKTLQGKKFPEKSKIIIDEISDLTTSAITEVREISHNLHPYQLEQLGLTRAVMSIIRKVSDSSGLRILQNIDNIDKLFDAETEINIYRIVQECINNVLKHSRASELNILITRGTNEVRINISDDGGGFDVMSEQNQGGLGMMSLQERARLCNAKIEVSSEMGKGTEVRIILEVPEIKQ